jgi:toxin ParE1/3/4
MKNNIHYSAESRRDLDDIWDYIVSELQNRVAAERVVDRILDAVERLKDFAEMDALLSSVADVGGDYRFLVSGNYMVFYRVNGRDVFIDRVLYGRRDYLRVLFRDMSMKQDD